MKKKIETTIHPFLKGRTANVFLKKSCLILLSLLLTVFLAACGSTPKEVEVPEEIAEFFHYFQEKGNTQVFMDLLVTDVEQTYSGDFPIIIEKYIACGNAFMMIVDFPHEGDYSQTILGVKKGDYTGRLEEVANKKQTWGEGAYHFEGLEDNRHLLFWSTSDQLENGEKYSFAFGNEKEGVSVVSWKMNIKGDLYNAIFPDFSTHGRLSVSSLGVSADLYLVGDVSTRFPQINVLSEDKNVLATYELSSTSYEQQEILGEMLTHVRIVPTNGLIQIVADLTGASEITIFDRSFKLEKAGQ